MFKIVQHGEPKAISESSSKKQIEKNPVKISNNLTSRPNEANESINYFSPSSVPSVVGTCVPIPREYRVDLRGSICPLRMFAPLVFSKDLVFKNEDALPSLGSHSNQPPAQCVQSSV
jgi:hypothetical protein